MLGILHNFIVILAYIFHGELKLKCNVYYVFNETLQRTKFYENAKKTT